MMKTRKIWAELNRTNNIILHPKYGDTFKGEAVGKAVNQYEAEIKRLSDDLKKANDRVKDLNKELRIAKNS